jgi:hypothetical protein
MPAAALRTVAAALVLAAPVAAAAAPAAPPPGAAAAAPAGPPRIGAPKVVRLARAGDARQRPRALTEWYSLAAINPRTGKVVRIRLARGQQIEGVDIASYPLVLGDRLGQQVDTRRPRSVRATGVDGTTVLRRAGRGWRLSFSGPRVSGSLRLSRVRRGPAGLRWRLGEDDLFRPRWEPVDLSWSWLVATSRLTGSLTWKGRRVRFNGWRASLEHVWGRFTVYDDVWGYGTSFVIHRRGGATIAFGLNRTDTSTGAGAYDAQWLGVLARVGRRGTRMCRPTVYRRRWIDVGFHWQAYARTMRARCGGTRIIFRTPADPTQLWGEQYLAHYQFAEPATATGGGRGIALFLGRKTFP